MFIWTFLSEWRFPKQWLFVCCVWSRYRLAVHINPIKKFRIMFTKIIWYIINFSIIGLRTGGLLKMSTMNIHNEEI